MNDGAGPHATFVRLSLKLTSDDFKCQSQTESARVVSLCNSGYVGESGLWSSCSTVKFGEIADTVVSLSLLRQQSAILDACDVRLTEYGGH